MMGRGLPAWLVLFATLVVFPTRSAFAQSQTSSPPPYVMWDTARRQAIIEARDGLHSSKPTEVAWGAFRAAEYRLRELVPELVARLEAPPESSGDESYALRSALLDAAVQLDAAVPAQVLQTYWKGFPVQSAILLAKATGPRDDVLLDLLSSSTDLPWYALANLLLQSRPNGFIQKVLTPLRLQLYVTVSEGGRTAGGGGYGAAIGDGIGQSAAGYPPRATYRFETGASPGYVVLSTGPRIVYYSRSVTYNFQFGVSEVLVGGPSATERLRYALGTTYPGQFEGNTAQTLGERYERASWEGADALQRRVQDLRADMLQAYQGFLSSLVAAQKLTTPDAESLAHPPVDVHLADARSNKSQPLPVIK